MNIRFLGQSCFYMQTKSGVSLVTDPFHSDIGFKMPKVSADIVTTSHDHYDHNNIGKIQGEYTHFDSPGDYEKSGVRLHGIASFHDADGGRKRGRNVIFKIEADGLKLCHLGDLGHVPDDHQLEQIGAVDILFIPVGEVFTFNVENAVKTMNLIKPAIVIPMHFKTKKLTLGLETERKFLKHAGGGNRLGSCEFEVTPETLEKYRGILIMEPQT
jgi:L-ascorbate metabolism protein UlaG (beta-lactamase superfamily)